MINALTLAGSPVALGALLVCWRRLRLRELSRLRLAASAPAESPVDAPAVPTRVFGQRQRLLPWLSGLLLGIGLFFLAGLPPVFCATFGLIAALLGSQLEEFRVTRLTLRIEEQLADALDLLVASLRAGAGMLSALEAAVRETRQPLRRELEELLGRIRYGDNPQTALRGLEARVPLETFRLLSSVLTVHWGVGGTVAPTLATIGRVVRDRIEVRRRVRALTTQARASAAAVLLLSYFIALVTWRSAPDRMQEFLALPSGQMLVAGAMLLQAVGLAWSSAMSRLRY